MNVDMYDCLSYSTTGAWLYPSYPPPGPQLGSEEVPVLLLLGLADLNQHQH